MDPRDGSAPLASVGGWHPVRSIAVGTIEETRGAGFLEVSAYHVVLAVKDERGDALAACGGLRSLTATRDVIPGVRAIPPKNLSRNPS